MRSVGLTRGLMLGATLLSLATGCGAAGNVPAASGPESTGVVRAQEDGDPGARREPLTSPSGPVRAHVLFVHGHGGDPWRFDQMRLALEKDGYATYTMAFPSMEEDMEWLAWWIKARVKEIKRDHGAREVDIVAHSMGGLISRAYIRYLEGGQHVPRVITFESPHHGLLVAAIPLLSRIMISENLRRQVAAGSPFFDRLNAMDETPGDVRYTSIISKNDQYISVKSAHLEGASNYVISGPNHTTSMWDPVVTALVKAALAEGRN